MNQAFLDFGVILHFELSENGGKHAEKAGRTSNSSSVFMHSPISMCHIYLPCVCVWATDEAHLRMALLLLHASVKAPAEPWPPATASPSNTHFTLPIPHMNNTWSDSLCWVNESIASRASETLMASQCRPLAGALLATRCPPCRVMNCGSFSALFCRAAKAIACGLVQHGWTSSTSHRRAPRLWCNVDLTAVCTWACRWGYMCEHAYEGRFNWCVYACVNKHLAEYLIVMKVVRRCSFLS